MAITNTIRLLKRAQPDRGKVEKLFAKKDDQVLLSALANPEHSDAARDILQDLADARGLQSAEARGWARTEAAMYVTPFGRQPSFEEALAAPARRRRIYRILQLIMLVGLVLGIFALTMGNETLGGLGVVLLIVGYLLWLFGGIYSWTGPCRTLLLRPFQAKKLSKPLTRFARKNLSFYGHTITLADKFVKESAWAYAISWIPRHPVDFIIIPLFFIPAVRQLQRWVRVSSPSSFRFLKNRLARRFTMNMFWQNSINKILKVKCSDVWWRQVVDLLMYSCQVIVVDMSLVKGGTEWELDKIDRRDLERKTLFVASEETADYAREVIARFWPADEAPPPLYVYNNTGNLLDYEAYHREVARIISKSHLWDGRPDAYPIKSA